MRTRVCSAVLIALLVAGASSNGRVAVAQVSVGLQLDWGSKTDFGVGGRAILDLTPLVRGLETVGSFDYFFPSVGTGADVTYWEVNANVVYRIATQGNSLTPYAGSGLHISRSSASVAVLGIEAEAAETRSGLNLVGGVMFDAGVTTPFLEARVELGGAEQVVMSAGVRF